MTQKEQVIDRILTVGYVDNFWCFNNRVSLRLGAIIFTLQKEGWVFRGEYQTTNGSDKNYHYYPIVVPEEYQNEKQKTLFQ